MLLVAVITAACQKENIALKEPGAAKIAATTSQRSNTLTSTLSFSGYTWEIRPSSGQAGPGPNYWSASNVWVDANGFLHLKAAYNPTTHHWECAEVYTQASLGYGTYQWQVEGTLGSFDKNVVLGLFNYSGNDGYDEMDIEIARWGNASANNLNYTIWPATGATATRASYTASFTTPGGTYTTHRFKRTANSVKLQSLYGFYDDDTNQFQTKTFTTPGTSISTLAMPVHMNLWFFSGRAPSDGQNVEVIIHSFKFTPLP